MKIDSLITGLVTGLVNPLVGMLIYYSLFLSHLQIATVIERTQADGKITAIVSIGCLANLALFYLFYRNEKDQAAKGVIMATFVYVGYVMFVKFA
jgi:hypothetical protein